MPEGVPTSVSRFAFSALVHWRSFATVWAISVCLHLRVYTIYSMLQLPTDHAWRSRVGAAIAYIIQGIFWFFGINGSNITGPIFTPILTALTLENRNLLPPAFCATQHYQSSLMFFTLFGGGGQLCLF